MIKGLLDAKRWAALWDAIPEYYIPGFLMTLKIAIVGLIVALILGIIFGTLSTMKFKPAKFISRIYVEVIQNTPLALQVMFYYMVLPMLVSGSGYRIQRDNQKLLPRRALIICRPCIISFFRRP